MSSDRIKAAGLVVLGVVILAAIRTRLRPIKLHNGVDHIA